MDYYYNNKGMYIIPLDAVELSLWSFDNVLPNYLEDYKPIWSKDNLRLRNEKCYYLIDFQNYANNSDSNKIKEATTDDDSIELKTYNCFICNLKVPQLFMGDHINSNKHKMYLTIANTAVKRVKLDMSYKYSVTTTKRSLYFCETCVAVMHVHDKSVHLLSEFHKANLKKDKILENLINVYVNDDAESNYEEFMSNSDENEGNASLDEYGPHYDIEDDNWSDVWDDENRKESALTQDEETHSLDSDKSYNMDVKPAYVVKTIDEGHYVIQIEGDCILKVDFDNFHGIDKLNKHRYQCKLCSDTFKRKHRHITCPKHVERILLYIKDKHCIRDLDSTKRHCVLCNELLDIDDQHIYNEFHKEQLQKSMLNFKEDIENCEQYGEEQFDATVLEEVKESKGVTKLNEKESELQSDENKYPHSTQACCDVCKVVTHVNGLQAHARGEKHKTNENQGVNYVMKKSPDKDFYTCEVCKTSLLLEETQHHLADPVHASQYHAFLNNNDISEMNKENGKIEEMFCNSCEMYMAKGNEIYHASSKTHKLMVQKLRGEDQALAIEAKLQNPEMSPPCPTETITQNLILDDESSKTNEQEDIMKMDNQHRLDGDGCKDVDVVDLIPKVGHEALQKFDFIERDKSVKVDKIHNMEFVHGELKKCGGLSGHNMETQMPLQTEEVECISTVACDPTIRANEDEDVDGVIGKDTASSIIDVASQNDKIISKCVETKKRDYKPHKKHDKFVIHPTSNEKKMFCGICKSVVPNNKRSIKEHINGLKHNNNVHQIFQDNKLKEIDDMLYCQICGEELIYGNQFSHIESKTHKRNLMNNRSELSKYAGAQTNVDPASDTKLSEGLEQRDDENKEKTESNFTANVDNIIEESSHRYKKVNANRYVIPGDDMSDKLLCIICDVEIPRNESSMEEHAKSAEHCHERILFFNRNEIVSADNKFRCLLCVEDFWPDDLYYHVKDEIHLMLVTLKLSDDVGDRYSSLDNYLDVMRKILKNSNKDEKFINNKLKMIEKAFRRRSSRAYREEQSSGLLNRNKRNVIRRNGIVTKDGRCYCRHCQERFPISEATEHIMKHKHIKSCLE